MSDLWANVEEIDRDEFARTYRILVGDDDYELESLLKIVSTRRSWEGHDPEAVEESIIQREVRKKMQAFTETRRRMTDSLSPRQTVC